MKSHELMLISVYPEMLEDIQAAGRKGPFDTAYGNPFQRGRQRLVQAEHGDLRGTGK